MRGDFPLVLGAFFVRDEFPIVRSWAITRERTGVDDREREDPVERLVRKRPESSGLAFRQEKSR
jgi:hypothetical protein